MPTSMLLKPTSFSPNFVCSLYHYFLHMPHFASSDRALRHPHTTKQNRKGNHEGASAAPARTTTILIIDYSYSIFLYDFLVAEEVIKMDKRERAKERREQRRHEISLLRTIPYSDHQRWWSSETLAVVTGANRGIGFEIAHQLVAHGVTVILTSRDVEVGQEATKVLQEGGFNVVFHQLDIINPSSIKEFTDWVQENYGGVDILVNNAGVNFNFGNDNSVEFAAKVVETNYFGTKNLIKAMIPLMRPSPSGARIVNVSTRLSKLNGRRNRLGDVNLRQQLSDVDGLSEELVDATVNDFLKQVEDGTWTSRGWPQSYTDYSLSKLAVNLYTRLMSRILSERPEGERIYINCYCPGWVKTAMTAYAGNISAEDGADTGVWLALLPPDQPVTGKFFAERREISF